MHNTQLKVLILHNDLRVYWKHRLIFLHEFLRSHRIDFYAIEIFGKGSPYDFEDPDNKEPWKDCLFPHHSYNELSKSKIKKKVFAKLSEINPDVVIAGSIVFFSGALGLRWAKINSKQFIMFDDAKPSNVKRNAFVQGIKDLITSQIDALWLPSDDYDKEYSLLYKKRNFFFFYGYNCIDNKVFNIRQRKSNSNGKIVCVARLVPIKNIKNLLRAWKFIEENNSSCELIIIGDGPLYNELNDFAKTMGLQRMKLLGSVPNEQLPLYLYDADAFVLPSWSESWGLVVNEAMAAGLPVLLSNKINAANTLLKEGVNGYSFSPYDIVQLQQKLTDFINLPDTSKKAMSDNSLQIINQMDYDNMGRELLIALGKLKQKPGLRPSWLPFILINFWHGRYNTDGWNSI